MPGNKRSAGANMVPSRQQRPRYGTRSRLQTAEPTNGESEVMRGRGRARSRGCGRTSVSRGRGQASRYRPSNLVNQTLGYCCGNLLIVARSMVFNLGFIDKPRR